MRQMEERYCNIVEWSRIDEDGEGGSAARCDGGITGTSGQGGEMERQAK